MDSATHLFYLPGFYEPFSAMSHLLGAATFFVLGIFTIRKGRGTAFRVTVLSIYSFACVFLLSMSGVYHMAVRGGTFHLVMKRLDHAAIFVLIAGTFTPVHGILFTGWRRWAPLAFIWTIAIASLTIKTIFFDDLAQWLSLLSYLILGWCGSFGGVLLYRRFGFAFIRPLLIGGLAYSIGAILDVLEWLRILPGVIHAHELFHVAVLVGVFYHWKFVWRFADGSVPPITANVPATVDES